MYTVNTAVDHCVPRVRKYVLCCSVPDLFCGLGVVLFSRHYFSLLVPSESSTSTLLVKDERPSLSVPLDFGLGPPLLAPLPRHRCDLLDYPTLREAVCLLLFCERILTTRQCRWCHPRPFCSSSWSAPAPCPTIADFSDADFGFVGGQITNRTGAWTERDYAAIVMVMVTVTAQAAAATAAPTALESTTSLRWYRNRHLPLHQLQLQQQPQLRQKLR